MGRWVHKEKLGLLAQEGSQDLWDPKVQRAILARPGLKENLELQAPRAPRERKGIVDLLDP